MALGRAMRILRLGVALGKPPFGGFLPGTPNFPIISCPKVGSCLGKTPLRGVPPRHCQLSYHPNAPPGKGDINTASRTSIVWENPHWGVRPDQTSYGCAGPILTKDQFRSRCVRAGIFYKTPREELSR